MKRTSPASEQKENQALADECLLKAVDFVKEHKLEKALSECANAIKADPHFAEAHNYRGMIFESLDNLQEAILSYRQAAATNPKFYAARENLRNARIRWERFLYERFSKVSAEDKAEYLKLIEEASFEEGSLDIYSENPSEPDLPGYFYLDRRSFLLRGYPGHRTRPGASGLDPMDTYMENAYVSGIILHLLLTGRFRTKTPFYLAAMSAFGLAGIFPLCVAVFCVFRGWTMNGIRIFLVGFPVWAIGILLLINVWLSFRQTDSAKEPFRYYF